MKNKLVLVLTASMTLLASCTTTRYGMPKKSLDNTMEEIKEEYHEMGYYLASENIGTAISQQISNTRDASNSVWAEDKANTKADFYSFQDTAGNTLSFAVAYNEALQGNTMYLLDVGMLGCEASNTKEYVNLCGKRAPINKIKQMPQDKPVTVGDAAATEKLMVWGSLGFLGASIIVTAVVLGGMY